MGCNNFWETFVSHLSDQPDCSEADKLHDYPFLHAVTPVGSKLKTFPNILFTKYSRLVCYMSLLHMYYIQYWSYIQYLLLHAQVLWTKESSPCFMPNKCIYFDMSFFQPNELFTRRAWVYLIKIHSNHIHGELPIRCVTSPKSWQFFFKF